MKLKYPKYLILIIYLLMSLAEGVDAQDALTIKLASIAVRHDNSGIEIGQRIPDTVLYEVFNYDKKKISRDDFEGKLVILDFWHQYCSSCIAQFPKLERLQKEFGDSILIMPVTFQSRNSVKDFFFKRAEGGSPVYLPSIVEDTLLRKYFPHDGDPYEVWIDGNGIIRAFTNDSSINKNLIEQALLNNFKELSAISLDPSFDIKRVFLVNENGGKGEDFIFRSILTKRNLKLRSAWYFNKDSAYLRIFVSNFSALKILRRMFFEIANNKNKYKDLMNDPLNKRAIIDPQLKMELSNLYCYDLMMPGKFSYEDGFETMLNQLKELFGIDLVIEKRAVHCLALVKINPKAQPKEGEQLAGSNKELTDTKRVVNYLNARSNFQYIFDTANDEIQVNMHELDKCLNDLDEMNKILSKYGLELIPREHNFSMLVFQRKRK